MLQFKEDDIAIELILTLTEKVSLAVPYYLFVFTHVLTKEKVKFIKSVLDDESGYQRRYNQFTVDPSVAFLDKPVGEWHYTVYEQESSSNTDETMTGAVLEYGKMMFGRQTAFAFKQYDSPVNYKAYNG